MSVVGRLEEGSPMSRIGGYYDTLEAAEDVADHLEFDVMIPPRASFGFYLVPAPRTSTEGDPVGPDQ